MTARKPAAVTPAMLARLTADQREWFGERAAIREFLGGQSRDEAERGALEDVRQMAQDRRRAQKGGNR